MCFALPVITSDQVGASSDLVCQGENGFVYQVGDIEALASYLQQIADLTVEERHLMGLKSRLKMERWVRRDLCGSLDQYVDLIHSR